MPHYLIFRLWLVGVVITPILISFYELNFYLANFLAIILFFTVQKLAFKKSSSSSYGKIFLILLIGFLPAYIYYQQSLPPKINSNIIGKELLLNVKVENIKKTTNGYFSFLQEIKPCISENCISFLNSSKFIDFEVGDNLKVKTKLTPPKENQNGFDFKNYLQRNYTTYESRYLKIESKIRNTSLEAILLRNKRRIEEIIYKSVSYPENSLLTGLITGSRTEIPNHLSIAFKELGLTHILAISGYNITLIISVIKQLLFFLSPLPRNILTIIIIIVFSVFVGGDPPVLRAAIMGILTVVALNFGSKTNLVNSLLLTATLMFIFDPQIINNDLSFQLSFAATLGVIYLQPLISKKLNFISKKFDLRENFSLTLAAQIATTPISLWNFGSLSLIAPISNLLVLPLVPLAMSLGIWGLILIPLVNLGEIPLKIAQLILKFMIKIVEILQIIPYRYLGN